MEELNLVNVVSGTCWKCTRINFGPDHREKGSECISMFELTRGMVTRNSPTGKSIVDVRDVLKCKECGELVPLDTWRSYQANGDIIVRKIRERRDLRGI